MKNKLYPIFLKLENKKILIIGGGMIALQKLVTVLDTEASITIIAPTIIDEILECRGEFPNIRPLKLIERDYEFNDEKGFDLVIAASNIPELNNSIANRCRDQNILVNSVDEPEHCDFYVPSVVSTGDIKIAISTNGKAPSVAQKIRLELEQLVQSRYINLLEKVSAFREKVKLKILGQENFNRRAKLVRWYTDRVFKKEGLVC